MTAQNGVIARMDRVVNDFVARCRYFREPMTRGRAKMFVLQHRLNTRQRNSVLKEPARVGALPRRHRRRRRQTQKMRDD
ncbi:MAG: hypothetical protein ACRET7_09495 [Burkholderiales bacterium]